MELKTAIAILHEDYNKDEYEIIEDCVDYWQVKHDTTAYYTIVWRKYDNTFWRLSWLASCNWGIEDVDVDVTQVKKEEFVMTVWKVVK
jgi:hypothetical protein